MQVQVLCVVHVHCAVCSVQCPACQGQRLSTSNRIILIKILFLLLGFQKRIASSGLKITQYGYMFLKASNEKPKFNETYLI